MISIMTENKKVISRSLIVLFLSLSIVYSLTYQKKENLFKATIQSSNTTTSTTWTENQYNWSAISANINTYKETTSKKEPTDSVSLWDIQPSWVNNSNTQIPNITESSNSASIASTSIKILPGTSEYLGVLDIVSILWEKPEFTLQDSKWNYFVYYWDHLNFIDTVEALGGNVYEMITEAEILQNQLFGDRVSYINLSMFKDIRVIMIIRIDGDVRLLQIPSDKYHYSKDYLKSLFIH